MPQSSASQELQGHADFLLRMSVRKSTQEMYTRHIQEYTNFHQSKDLGRMFRLQSLRCYVAHLHQEGKAYSSILGQMSALKYFCRLKGQKNDLDNPTVLMTLRGVRNVTSLRTNNRSFSQVLSIRDLQKFNRIATTLFEPYRARLIQAIMVTAFFGFFESQRVCEDKSRSYTISRGLPSRSETSNPLHQNRKV